MTYNQIKDVMESRGFELFSTANPGSVPVYNYVKTIDGVNVHCAVQMDCTFVFTSITGLCQIKTNQCSPVDSDEQFNKILKMHLDTCFFGISRGIDYPEHIKDMLKGSLMIGGPY